MLHKYHPAPCRYPYVTGTSVLGITYKDGVLLASDTLGGQGGAGRSMRSPFDRGQGWMDRWKVEQQLGVIAFAENQSARCTTHLLLQ